MSRTVLILLLVAGLALVIGCARSTEDAGDETMAAETSEMETPAGDAEVMATAVELDGHLGCAHCTYHVAESCGLAMETDEGDVVMLDAGDREAELMAVRYDQPAIHLKGKMSEINGQKIIYAEAIDLQ